MSRVLVSLVLFLAVVQVSLAQQVTDLQAKFRDGQTFLTWKEVGGEHNKYRIYRSSTPIASADQLTTDSLVVQVGEFTSLNLMASIKRIDLNANREYEMPRKVFFIIEDGAEPLAEDDGLFVYTAKKDEPAYYAVTAVVDGNENREIAAGANALTEAVQEKIEPVQPVKQNDRVDFVHWTDDVGTENYPAMSARPGTPYNFRLIVPNGEGPFPVVGLLHGMLFQYNQQDFQERPQREGDDTAARLFFDVPVMQGRIKGLDLEGTTPASWSRGMFGGGSGRSQSSRGSSRTPSGREDLEARVLWTYDWIKEHYPIDPDRVVIDGGSMGGIQAITIGLQNPEHFSVIRTVVPPLNMGARFARPESSSRPATRTAQSAPTTSRSRSSSMFGFVPAYYVEEHPEIDFPLVIITAGRTDHIVGWPDKLEYAKASEKSKTGYMLFWHPGGHGGEGIANTDEKIEVPKKNLPFADVTTIRRNQTYPAVANCTANDDPGTVNLAVRQNRPPLDSPGVGDLYGTLNGYVKWERDTIVDEPQRWEITMALDALADVEDAKADITPRRAQQFKAEPNSEFKYEVLQMNSGERITSGTVSADEHGLVTVTNVPLNKRGTRLTIFKQKP